MRRTLWISILLACMLTLSIGCGKEEVQPQPETESETQPIVETEEMQPPTQEEEVLPSHEGQTKSLYTGEWIDEAVAKKRPVAVMTENTKVTLPQYGLSKADVIYECPVEGGITRLMAIYQDYTGMEKIGNVRSCRLYYIYFAKEFDAVYFHAGQSKYALDVLESSFIDNVNGITGKGGEFYYRDKSRKAPHNLYTSSDKIERAIEDHGYRAALSGAGTPHYQFADEDSPVTLADGEDAEVVSLYYVNPKPWFVYNREDGMYYRYEFDEPQKDGLTGEQLKVKNIILQNCKSSLMDSKNGTLDINYLSGGSGKFITEGRAIDITWTRESSSSPTKYFDMDGREIVLNPGKTWVEIIESSKAEKNGIFAAREEFGR